MNCPQCGVPVEVGATQCSVCGAALPPSIPTPPPVQMPPTLGAQMTPATPSRTSGFAIAALVLGIFALISFGSTALLGVIFGIIGIVQTGKSQGRLTGNGMAIAGLSISAIALVTLPIMAAILFPVFSKSREKARMAQCMSNQKQIALAAMMYAQENNEVMPSQWAELGLDGKVTRCPSASQENILSNSYGYNYALVKKPVKYIDRPEVVLLTADGGDSENYVNSEADIVKRHNGSKGFNASYADGHIEYVKAGTPVTLR